MHGFLFRARRDRYLESVYQSTRKGKQPHAGCTALTTESHCGLEGPHWETQSQFGAFQSTTAAALQAPGTHPNPPSEPSPLLMDPNDSSSPGSQPGRLATREKPRPWGSKQGAWRNDDSQESDFWNLPFTKRNQESRHSKINRQKADPWLLGTRVGKWGVGDGNVLTPN